MISRVTLGNPLAKRSLSHRAAAGPKAEDTQADTVDLSGKPSAWGRWAKTAVAATLALAMVGNSVTALAAPQLEDLMVGAPTAHLTTTAPTVKSPNIGISLGGNLGISLDGRTLLVGHDQPGKMVIDGRTEDGSLPQRVFEVNNDGAQTRINGYYQHQDFTLTADSIDGNDRTDDVKVVHGDDFIRVESPFPARSFTARQKTDSIEVTSGTGVRYTITETDDLGLSVQSSIPYESFTIDQNGIDGNYAYQDFKFEGHQIEGLYPQQQISIQYQAE